MRKNILQHLFKNGSCHNGIDLEFIYTIPEFNILSSCDQNPRWHSEGNVMKHTLLVYETLQKVLINNCEIYFSLTEDELLILRSAALFHDIGKGVTTSVGKDGKIHAYGHEYEGEKIVRVLLWNEDIHIREEICSLIHYHMEVLKIFDSNNSLNKIIEIGSRISWKLLYLLKMSDILGSIQEAPSTTDEDVLKLELIKETAKSLNVWDKKSNESLKKVNMYLNNKHLLQWKTKTSDEKIAYLMIGLPGSGKNTYITNNILTKFPNAVQISRDDIRIELGFCKDGEKYLGTEDEERQVTNRCNELFDESVLSGKVIVLNSTHLKKKYRSENVKTLRFYGYKVIFVYVEAPTLEFNYKRRDGEVTKEVIDRMALSFEWPDITEYDELIIDKQTY